MAELREHPLLLVLVVLGTLLSVAGVVTLVCVLYQALRLLADLLTFVAWLVGAA